MGFGTAWAPSCLLSLQQNSTLVVLSSSLEGGTLVLLHTLSESPHLAAGAVLLPYSLEQQLDTGIVL